MGALLSLAGPSRADDVEDLRAKVVAATEEARAALLKGLEGYPSQVGGVLGPILRDRTLKTPSAQAAAWLADLASKDGEILLVDELLRRAQDDPAYVEEMRRFFTSGKGGAAALAAAARKRLTEKGSPEKAAADVALKTAAAWYLRFDPTIASARDLAEAWTEAPADVQRIASESLAAMLAFRFETAAAARAFLASHEKTAFVDCVRELSVSKETLDSPLYRRLVQESRANIERASTVAELQRYLLAKETPWVEVRRLAARRASKIVATGEVWLPVLEESVRNETDKEALASLLEVSSRLKDLPADRTAQLAKAAVSRLAGCCNSPEVLKGLLGVLARVGDPETIARAYEEIRDVQDPGVLEIWLSSAGSVGGSELALRLCEFHKSRVAAKDEAVAGLRVRALEALAQGAQAPGATWSAVAVASTYLRGILRRDDSRPDERSMPREEAPAVRMAAVRSLEGFPSPETVARLKDLVSVPPEDVAVARIAVSVLGKLAAKIPEAAEALVEVARSASASEVRIEAVKDLARLAPDAKEEVRDAALTAIRNALQPSTGAGALELRVAAAESAAALGDPGALAGVFDLAAETATLPAGPVHDRIESSLAALVQTVAKADGKSDAAVLAGLKSLASAGALDTAVVVAGAAASAGGSRLPLQSARADLLLRRARSTGREAAARRADLEEAHRLLRSALSTLVGAEADADATLQAYGLHQEIVTALLDDPEVKNGVRRSALVSGVDAVAKRRDATAAARATTWAQEALALVDLAAGERETLERALSLIQKLKGP